MRNSPSPHLDDPVNPSEVEFEPWMRKHYALVLAQSRRMLLVPEDAEDVAQQVFIKAWKAWSSFEGNGPQRVAWLLKITRNASVDAARKRNLRRMAPLDVVLEERTAQVLSSPDFDGDVILARLHAAISTLPPRQRWVFQARYFGGRSYAELAKETGKSEGALKASFHHARKKIESFIQEQAAEMITGH